MDRLLTPTPPLRLHKGMGATSTVSFFWFECALLYFNESSFSCGRVCLVYLGTHLLLTLRIPNFLVSSPFEFIIRDDLTILKQSFQPIRQAGHCNFQAYLCRLPRRKRRNLHRRQCRIDVDLVSGDTRCF